MTELPDYAMPFSRRDSSESDFLKDWKTFLDSEPLSNSQMLMNFPMFTTRQDLARFIFRLDIFRQVLDVHGSIIECGVAYGGGLMSFAHLSSILEPYNYSRKIIGFDTFSGFPSIHEKDDSGQASDMQKVGAMATDAYEVLTKTIELADRNRPIGHLPKVQIVRGDIIEAIPKYVTDNPHLIVSLLYLDADLYEPTEAALRHIVPRMPKGAIIAFDEANDPQWPGETVALLERLNISDVELKRTSYDSTRCYARI
jgi:hypothetical protein